jgi:hypothetical protein
VRRNHPIARLPRLSDQTKRLPIFTSAVHELLVPSWCQTLASTCRDRLAVPHFVRSPRRIGRANR